MAAVDRVTPTTDYLERHVFPVLEPALEEMLRAATKTERRRCFNSLDYLVEYLYKHNPNHSNREDITLHDIPFVQQWIEKHPRPPLPLSATLSEEEAATIIQAAYRAYKVRCEEEVQLFRQWQRGFRKELQAVRTIQRRWRQYRAHWKPREKSAAVAIQNRWRAKRQSRNKQGAH